MLITYILIAAAVGAAAVIAISVYNLTHKSIGPTIIEHIPDAQSAVVTDIISSGNTVTSPKTVKLSVRDRYGNTKEMDITAEKTDYFYRNERISNLR